MSVSIKNILVAYDGFERNEGIPALAPALALEHRARLHVVHVTPRLPKNIWQSSRLSAEELQRALMDTRRARLEELLASARKKGVTTRVIIRAGSPHIEIIREAMSIEADLLIVSDGPAPDGGRGFHSVTMKLFRNCPCPVLAKRDTRKFKHRRILAALDVEAGTPDEASLNHRIVELAATLARRVKSHQLCVFHAWQVWGENLLRGRAPDEDIRALVEETKTRRREQLDQLLGACDLEDVDLEIDFSRGDARSLLPDVVAAKKIDLVVMGTVSRTGLKGLIIGNTAERILNKLTCSVLAVKPEGFVSPVSAANEE